MGKITILPETIKNPISLAGKMAGVAYGSDITSDEKNYKRGLQCIKDGHGRVLEFAEVYFTLEGYSNRVIREFMRHVGDGLSVIQESTRYVDFAQGFEYIIPPSIQNCKDSFVIKTYTDTMRTIKEALYTLSTYDIPKEDAQMLIPLGATTKLSVKKNMRNLMEMSRVRMCNRAYWEFRELMQDLKKALCEYSPEWKELCDMLLYAKCEKTKTCEEKFSCGKYPKEN